MVYQVRTGDQSIIILTSERDCGDVSQALENALPAAVVTTKPSSHNFCTMVLMDDDEPKASGIITTPLLVTSEPSLLTASKPDRQQLSEERNSV